MAQQTMSQRDRKIRRMCPYVQLVGGRGYVCNKPSYWSKDPEPKMFVQGRPDPKGDKPCFGCRDMHQYVHI